MVSFAFVTIRDYFRCGHDVSSTGCSVSAIPGSSGAGTNLKVSGGPHQSVWKNFFLSYLSTFWL